MDDSKKNLWKDVRRIQEEMDLLFDHFYKLKHSPVLTSRRVWRPPTDVYETDEGVVIRMEIAGMRQQDLNVTLSADILNIKGERKERSSAHRTAYQNMEINYGPFERNIRLAKQLDGENVEAVYKDGFLEINLSRKPGKVGKSKDIKIEVE
jgi:HSP20 family protein